MKQTRHERLDEIAALPQGWHCGQNPAPTPESIFGMKRFLEMMNDGLGLPEPHLYPMPSGNVVAEWTHGDWEISAEVVAAVDLHMWTVELNLTNIKTGEEFASWLPHPLPKLDP